MITPRNTRLPGNVTHMKEMRNEYNILAGKPGEITRNNKAQIRR
jgi:hypothetical protein